MENKYKFLSLRITTEQSKELQQIAKISGFYSVSEFVRNIVFSQSEDILKKIHTKVDQIHKVIVPQVSVPKKELNEVIDELEVGKMGRRSFVCNNKMWDLLEKKTNDIVSVSHLIRKAIIHYFIEEDR